MAPKIAILGFGRAGKDTAGEIIGKMSPLRYVGSTSQVVCPMIAKDLGLTPEAAWADRHNNRMYWWRWCNEYRKDDPTKIARASLATGDLVVGLRDAIELEACKAAKLFDLILWINRDVPVDPTVTFRREDCDVVIDNNDDLPTLEKRLARLLRFAGVPVTTCLA